MCMRICVYIYLCVYGVHNSVCVCARLCVYMVLNYSEGNAADGALGDLYERINTHASGTSDVCVEHCACLRLARIIYIHRVRPYIW
jgi:hypothetical protein